jgi:hypothetical protein
MNPTGEDPVDLSYGPPKRPRGVAGPGDGAVVRTLKYVLVAVVLLPIVGGLLLVIYLLFGGGEALETFLRRMM